MRFGEYIRKMRLEQRMSQRALAEKVGIDFTYLSKIENNKTAPPSNEVIRKLARELGVDAEELLALAAKVSQDELRQTVARDPRLGVLFRKLQSGELSDKQIREMLDVADIEADDVAPDHHQ